MVRVDPATVQTDGVPEVKVTGNPEVEVALSVNGGSPNVCGPVGVGNVIVCGVLPTPPGLPGPPLTSIVIEFAVPLEVARSGFPSPLNSPAAISGRGPTANGLPAASVKCGVEAPSPSNTETVPD